MRLPVSCKFLSRLLPLGACALSFASLSWGDWPDGPGKDLTLKLCGNCHEPERAASLQQDKDGWAATISSMVGRGMEISDTDYAAVLGYLAKTFPAQELPPLKINSASTIDMESALGLLRSEASAIVAYRDKNGKFKSIEDLKKVPGINFAKIEEKKDRIAF